MAKSNELRGIIASNLNNLKTTYGIKEISYSVSQSDELYPHIVFAFDGARTLVDCLSRRDYKLIIDVWDRGHSAVAVNNIADAVEDLFDSKNAPATNVLPTFYLEQRRDLADEDKMIRHIQLEFTIQNYERN